MMFIGCFLRWFSGLRQEQDLYIRLIDSVSKQVRVIILSVYISRLPATGSNCRRTEEGMGRGGGSSELSVKCWKKVHSFFRTFLEKILFRAIAIPSHDDPPTFHTFTSPPSPPPPPAKPQPLKLNCCMLRSYTYRHGMSKLSYHQAFCAFSPYASPAPSSGFPTLQATRSLHRP